MIREGTYEIPAIGSCENPEFGRLMESQLTFKDDILTVHSPLYGDYSVGDGSIFRDPRLDGFVKAFTEYFFHHLETRQLSLPEEYETRNGAGRYGRLVCNVDSARMVADLGGTFEQGVQTLLSDAAMPAGSHLRGDHIVGDYINESSHDGDLLGYITRSGFVEYLRAKNLLEGPQAAKDTRLVGSAVLLSTLCNPDEPRRYDIVECPRPDPNADRLPFTVQEGILMYGRQSARDILNSLMRVEDVNGEERIATNSLEAAITVYKMSERHLLEHWGELVHHIVTELVLFVDKYDFLTEPSKKGWSPVDISRIAEHLWYDNMQATREKDEYSDTILTIAQNLARQQRAKDMELLSAGSVYEGPAKMKDVQFVKTTLRDLQAGASVELGPYDATGSLWVNLPEHKYRTPIDMLVATKKGLKRVSSIRPELVAATQAQRHWLEAHRAEIQLPRDQSMAIAEGLDRVQKGWNGNNIGRRLFPAAEMAARITLSRDATMRRGRIATQAA